jgi:hypothetical protein
MVLMVRPEAWNTTTAASTETGIATSETAVRARVRQEEEQHRGDHRAASSSTVRRCGWRRR